MKLSETLTPACGLCDEARRGGLPRAIDAREELTVRSLVGSRGTRDAEVLGRHRLASQTMEQRDRRAVINAHYPPTSASLHPHIAWSPTFKILGTLPFLGRLGDDLDRPTRKDANLPLALLLALLREASRHIISHSDPYERLDFLLPVVVIRDEQLLAHASAHVRGHTGTTSGWVLRVERLPSGGAPFGETLQRTRFTGDGDHGLGGNRDRGQRMTRREIRPVPPIRPYEHRGRRGAQEPAIR